MIMSLVTYTYDRFLAMSSDVLLSSDPFRTEKSYFQQCVATSIDYKNFSVHVALGTTEFHCMCARIGFPEGVAFSAAVECTHVHHIKKFLL